MLSKSIFISIFIAVYLRSSVAKDPIVIQVESDTDFLTHAQQSLEMTVGIIVTNLTTPFPDWMIKLYKEMLNKFFVISVIGGSSRFIKIREYLNNTGQYPTLYAMQKGVVLVQKLFICGRKTTEKMKLAILDPNAKKLTGWPVTVDLFRPAAERVRPAAAGTAGSTAVCTDRSPILNRQPTIQFDLNELPTPEDNSSKKRKSSGGSEVTPSFQCTWGATYSYDEPRPSGSASVPTGSGSAKGSSKSPQAQTRSGSGRSSNSPPAPTSSGRSRWPN